MPSRMILDAASRPAGHSYRGGNAPQVPSVAAACNTGKGISGEEGRDPVRQQESHQQLGPQQPRKQQHQMGADAGCDSTRCGLGRKRCVKRRNAAAAAVAAHAAERETLPSSCSSSSSSCSSSCRAADSVADGVPRCEDEGGALPRSGAAVKASVKRIIPEEKAQRRSSHSSSCSVRSSGSKSSSKRVSSCSVGDSTKSTVGENSRDSSGSSMGSIICSLVDSQSGMDNNLPHPSNQKKQQPRGAIAPAVQQCATPAAAESAAEEEHAIAETATAAPTKKVASAGMCEGATPTETTGRANARGKTTGAPEGRTVVEGESAGDVSKTAGEVQAPVQLLNRKQHSKRQHCTTAGQRTPTLLHSEGERRAGLRGEAPVKVEGADSKAISSNGVSRKEGEKGTDLVWFKKAGAPWWPGVICSVGDALRTPSLPADVSSRNNHLLVMALGRCRYEWVEPSDIRDFRQAYDTLAPLCRGVGREARIAVQMGLEKSNWTDNGDWCCISALLQQPEQLPSDAFCVSEHSCPSSDENEQSNISPKMSAGRQQGDLRQVPFCSKEKKPQAQLKVSKPEHQRLDPEVTQKEQKQQHTKDGKPKWFTGALRQQRTRVSQLRKEQTQRQKDQRKGQVRKRQQEHDRICNTEDKLHTRSPEKQTIQKPGVDEEQLSCDSSSRSSGRINGNNRSGAEASTWEYDAEKCKSAHQPPNSSGDEATSSVVTAVLLDSSSVKEPLREPAGVSEVTHTPLAKSVASSRAECSVGTDTKKSSSMESGRTKGSDHHCSSRSESRDSSSSSSTTNRCRSRCKSSRSRSSTSSNKSSSPSCFSNDCVNSVTDSIRQRSNSRSSRGSQSHSSRCASTSSNRSESSDGSNRTRRSGTSRSSCSSKARSRSRSECSARSDYNACNEGSKGSVVTPALERRATAGGTCGDKCVVVEEGGDHDRADSSPAPADTADGAAGATAGRTADPPVTMKDTSCNANPCAAMCQEQTLHIVSLVSQDGSSTPAQCYEERQAAAVELVATAPGRASECAVAAASKKRSKAQSKKRPSHCTQSTTAPPGARACASSAERGRTRTRAGADAKEAAGPKDASVPVDAEPSRTTPATVAAEATVAVLVEEKAPAGEGGSGTHEGTVAETTAPAPKQDKSCAQKCSPVLVDSESHTAEGGNELRAGEATVERSRSSINSGCNNPCDSSRGTSSAGSSNGKETLRKRATRAVQRLRQRASRGQATGSNSSQLVANEARASTDATIRSSETDARLRPELHEKQLQSKEERGTAEVAPSVTSDAGQLDTRTTSAAATASTLPCAVARKINVCGGAGKNKTTCSRVHTIESKKHRGREQLKQVRVHQQQTQQEPIIAAHEMAGREVSPAVRDSIVVPPLNEVACATTSKNNNGAAAALSAAPAQLSRSQKQDTGKQRRAATSSAAGDAHAAAVAATHRVFSGSKHGERAAGAVQDRVTVSATGAAGGTQTTGGERRGRGNSDRNTKEASVDGTNMSEKITSAHGHQLQIDRKEQLRQLKGQQQQQREKETQPQQRDSQEPRLASAHSPACTDLLVSSGEKKGSEAQGQRGDRAAVSTQKQEPRRAARSGASKEERACLLVTQRRSGGSVNSHSSSRSCSEGSRSGSSAHSGSSSSSQDRTTGNGRSRCSSKRSRRGSERRSSTDKSSSTGRGSVEYRGERSTRKGIKTRAAEDSSAEEETGEQTAADGCGRSEDDSKESCLFGSVGSQQRTMESAPANVETRKKTRRQCLRGGAQADSDNCRDDCVACSSDDEDTSAGFDCRSRRSNGSSKICGSPSGSREDRESSRGNSTGNSSRRSGASGPCGTGDGVSHMCSSTRADRKTDTADSSKQTSRSSRSNSRQDVSSSMGGSVCSRRSHSSSEGGSMKSPDARQGATKSRSGSKLRIRERNSAQSSSSNTVKLKELSERRGLSVEERETAAARRSGVHTKCPTVEVKKPNASVTCADATSAVKHLRDSVGKRERTREECSSGTAGGQQIDARSSESSRSSDVSRRSSSCSPCKNTGRSRSGSSRSSSESVSSREHRGRKDTKSPRRRCRNYPAKQELGDEQQLIAKASSCTQDPSEIQSTSEDDADSASSRGSSCSSRSKQSERSSSDGGESRRSSSTGSHRSRRSSSNSTNRSSSGSAPNSTGNSRSNSNCSSRSTDDSIVGQSKQHEARETEGGDQKKGATDDSEAADADEEGEATGEHRTVFRCKVSRQPAPAVCAAKSACSGEADTGQDCHRNRSSRSSSRSESESPSGSSHSRTSRSWSSSRSGSRSHGSDSDGSSRSSSRERSSEKSSDRESSSRPSSMKSSRSRSSSTPEEEEHRKARSKGASGRTSNRADAAHQQTGKRKRMKRCTGASSGTDDSSNQLVSNNEVRPATAVAKRHEGTKPSRNTTASNLATHTRDTGKKSKMGGLSQQQPRPLLGGHLQNGGLVKSRSSSGRSEELQRGEELSKLGAGQRVREALRSTTAKASGGKKGKRPHATSEEEMARKKIAPGEVDAAGADERVAVAAAAQGKRRIKEERHSTAAAKASDTCPGRLHTSEGNATTEETTSPAAATAKPQQSHHSRRHGGHSVADKNGSDRTSTTHRRQKRRIKDNRDCSSRSHNSSGSCGHHSSSSSQLCSTVGSHYQNNSTHNSSSLRGRRDRSSAAGNSGVGNDSGSTCCSGSGSHTITSCSTSTTARVQTGEGTRRSRKRESDKRGRRERELPLPAAPGEGQKSSHSAQQVEVKQQTRRRAVAEEAALAESGRGSREGKQRSTGVGVAAASSSEATSNAAIFTASSNAVRSDALALKTAEGAQDALPSSHTAPVAKYVQLEMLHAPRDRGRRHKRRRASAREGRSAGEENRKNSRSAVGEKATPASSGAKKPSRAYKGTSEQQKDAAVRATKATPLLRQQQQRHRGREAEGDCSAAGDSSVSGTGSTCQSAKPWISKNDVLKKQRQASPQQHRRDHSTAGEKQAAAAAADVAPVNVSASSASPSPSCNRSRPVAGGSTKPAGLLVGSASARAEDAARKKQQQQLSACARRSPASTCTLPSAAVGDAPANTLAPAAPDGSKRHHQRHHRHRAAGSRSPAGRRRHHHSSSSRHSPAAAEPAGEPASVVSDAPGGKADETAADGAARGDSSSEERPAAHHHRRSGRSTSTVGRLRGTSSRRHREKHAHSHVRQRHHRSSHRRSGSRRRSSSSSRGSRKHEHRRRRRKRRGSSNRQQEQWRSSSTHHRSNSRRHRNMQRGSTSSSVSLLENAYGRAFTKGEAYNKRQAEPRSAEQFSDQSLLIHETNLATDAGGEAAAAGAAMTALGGYDSPPVRPWWQAYADSITAHERKRKEERDKPRHETGRCTPCNFVFSRAGCKYGNTCSFCHSEDHRSEMLSLMNPVRQRNSPSIARETAALHYPAVYRSRSSRGGETSSSAGSRGGSSRGRRSRSSSSRRRRRSGSRHTSSSSGSRRKSHSSRRRRHGGGRRGSWSSSSREGGAGSRRSRSSSRDRRRRTSRGRRRRRHYRHRSSSTARAWSSRNSRSSRAGAGGEGRSRRRHRRRGSSSRTRAPRLRSSRRSGSRRRSSRSSRSGGRSTRSGSSGSSRAGRSSSRSNKRRSRSSSRGRHRRHKGSNKTHNSSGRRTAASVRRERYNRPRGSAGWNLDVREMRIMRERRFRGDSGEVGISGRRRETCRGLEAYGQPYYSPPRRVCTFPLHASAIPTQLPSVQENSNDTPLFNGCVGASGGERQLHLSLLASDLTGNRSAGYASVSSTATSSWGHYSSRSQSRSSSGSEIVDNGASPKDSVVPAPPGGKQAAGAEETEMGATEASLLLKKRKRSVETSPSRRRRRCPSSSRSRGSSSALDRFRRTQYRGWGRRHTGDFGAAESSHGRRGSSSVSRISTDSSFRSLLEEAEKAVTRKSGSNSRLAEWRGSVRGDEAGDRRHYSSAALVAAVRERLRRTRGNSRDGSERYRGRGATGGRYYSLPRMTTLQSLQLQQQIKTRHDWGRCRPCRFHYEPSGCRKGSTCEYCHDESHVPSTAFEHRSTRHIPHII